MLSSRTLRRSAKKVRLVLSGNPAENDDEFRWRGKKVTKEVVGIHVLLTRSLFACDILRRFLRRVSLAKPTSAPVRFLWLHRTKPQFGSPQHPKSRETHRGAGAVRHSNRGAQIFQPVLPPRLLPQELQRYDPL